MKILNIASTFTNINDLYIAEAAEMPYETAKTPYEKRPNPIIHFFSSGFGVALLCLLVSAAVTVGIIAAGRAPDHPAGNPAHKNFAFSYEIVPARDEYLYGNGFTVHTTVKNLGSAFTVTGSSTEFSADAWLVPHGTRDVFEAEHSIRGLFASTDDYVTQRIDTGDEGHSSGFFTITREVAPGDYDLVLSYKGEYQVFEKAITVADIPWVLEDIKFSIKSYPEKKEYVSGETVTLDFAVTGFDPTLYSGLTDGAPLEQGYTLSAVLTLHGRGKDDAAAIVGNVVWDKMANLAVSSTAWAYYTADFRIPADADVGLYDLHLLYVGTHGDDRVEETVEPEILSVISPRFGFSYSTQPDTSIFLLGQSYAIHTVVENLGDPFTVTGSSQAFSAEALLVRHNDPERTILGTFWYDEDVVTQEIATGQKGKQTGYFSIPADAATGVYDLWLSYGGEQRVFEKAISVEDPTVLPLLKNVNFSDPGIYERLKGFALVKFSGRWGLPPVSYEDTREYQWEVPGNYDYVTVTFSPEGLSESFKYTKVMKATVTERRGDGLILEPAYGEEELNISTAFYGNINDAEEKVRDLIQEGTTVYIAYDGEIVTSSPSQLIDVRGLYTYPPMQPRIYEVEAREIAHTFMKDFEIAVPLEDMHVGIIEQENREYYHVSYTYLLGGFLTSYKFTMEVGYDGILRNLKPSTWDPQAYYAVYTDEDVREARDRIHQKMTDELGVESLPSGIGVFKQRDGKLYIYIELILDCNHEDGEDCWMGHHHYSFEEEVIKAE